TLAIVVLGTNSTSIGPRTRSVEPSPAWTGLVKSSRDDRYSCRATFWSQRHSLIAAESFGPPAATSASTAVRPGRYSTNPGFLTSPPTHTRFWYTSLMLTAMAGSRRFDEYFVSSCLESSDGVSPAASTSPTSGSVILPSLRTRTALW